MSMYVFDLALLFWTESNATYHPLSSFYPPKIDVALKITIEFMIDHY